MIQSQEQAYQYAQPYFAKEGTQVVYVNEHGLVWVNNEAAQMDEYFAKKGERYFVFQNVTVEEQPMIEEAPSEDQPKKSRKKQS